MIEGLAERGVKDVEVDRTAAIVAEDDSGALALGAVHGGAAVELLMLLLRRRSGGRGGGSSYGHAGLCLGKGVAVVVVVVGLHGCGCGREEFVVVCFDFSSGGCSKL